MNNLLVAQMKIVQAMLDEFPKLRLWAKSYLAVYHPDEKAKADVLVEIYQGVINDVSVLSHEKAAKAWQKWAEKQGYEDYDAFLKALQEGVDEELRWYPDLKLEMAA